MGTWGGVVLLRVAIDRPLRLAVGGGVWLLPRLIVWLFVWRGSATSTPVLTIGNSQAVGGGGINKNGLNVSQRKGRHNALN